MEITNRQIERVALSISYGMLLEEIHANLLKEGLSEEEIFLAYCAGKVLFKAWQAEEGEDRAQFQQETGLSNLYR